MRMAVLWAFTAALAAQDPAPKPVPFEEIGNEFLVAHGAGGIPTFAELLGDRYARMQLGLFDVRWPAHRLDQKGAERLLAIAPVLIDLQLRFAEWCGVQALPEEAVLLQKWLVSQKPKALVEATKDWTKADKDLFVTLAAPAKELSARDKFADWMRSGTCLGLARAERPASIVVFAPSRREFVGFVGYVGLLRDEYRQIFWRPATAQWTDLWLPVENHAQVIALEYAAPAPADWSAGFEMNAREKTGLLQHVVQRAAFSLLWNTHGDRIDPLFQSAIAQNLVIAVLKENNARSGGSGKSNETAAQTVFIPGAPSQGGALAMVSADSRWRATYGKDWFQRPLRTAQRAAAKEKKGAPNSGFLLQDKSDHARLVVNAPFVGKQAFAMEAIPPAFLDDYLEFHRAYRSAFVHWLQTQGNDKVSTAKFGDLMRLLAYDEMGFETAVEGVYGVTLTVMEQRFLAWLATSN